MTEHDSPPERDRTGEPVEGFGTFTWRMGSWERIFDRQVDAIKDELARAQAEDRVVVYLSCPISSRGGGSFRTNVDIASFTARRLMHEWGERLYVLNPAAYQMESREGTGLILEHVRELFSTTDPQAYLETLRAGYQPGGGDYLRMWIRVLVEDDRYHATSDEDKPRRNLSCGGMFDAFYFLGPADIRSFFAGGEESSVTQAVESYFARKYAMDLDFRRAFDVEPSGAVPPDAAGRAQDKAEQTWEHRRKAFFRYYALRASASYSLGSRDEWNTLVRLNRKRRESKAYGPGEELACYFDGRQVNLASTLRTVARGYEESGHGTSADHPREITWPKGLT